VKDVHHQEYHSDGHKEDKDLGVDCLEDHQEEAEDHLGVEDRQQESQCPCHKRPNQEDIMETS
jgi:hypothetical protein